MLAGAMPDPVLAGFRSSIDNIRACYGKLGNVVDRSTVKQGRYTPGTRLKICDPSKLVEDQPDYCLLLTWNFAEEVLAQQSQYRQQGGKFIVPIPNVRVA